MSPQRRPVQGSIPQRRLMPVETRPRSAVPASAPQSATTSSAKPPTYQPIHKIPVTTPKPTFSQPVQSAVRPQPFHQKLPSAAELAALTQHKVSRPNTQPKQAAKPHYHAANPVQNIQAAKPAVHVSRHSNPQPASQKPLFEKVIAAEKNKNTGKKRQSRKAQILFVSAAVLVFIIGITVSVIGMRTNQQVAAQAKVLGQSKAGDQSGSGDDDTPAENPIGRNLVAAYKVAPDAPRKLIIPKLGVDTRVLDLGLKPSGELKTPSNIYDAGWYNNSAKPGLAGATLIDGHVHGPTQPGVFYNLKKLVKDDVILVERGDGTQVKYKVVKTQMYDSQNTDMKAAMTPVVANKSGLNLITCTGKVDKKTSTYNERLIVFTTIDQ